MNFELQKLDEEIARIPTSSLSDDEFNLRAELMAKRVRLDQDIRAAAAANGRQPPKGNLVVNVPGNVGISHLYGRNGRVACSRVTEDGRVVIDLFLDELRVLLGDRKHGLHWHNANTEILSQVA